MIQKKKLVESLGSNLMKMGGSIAFLSFITFQFSIETTGIYFLVISVMTILGDLKEGFLLNGFIKYLVEEKDTQKVISTALFISLLWDFCNVVIYLILSLWFPELQAFTAAFIILLLFSSLARWVNYIHRSQLDTSTQLKSNVITTVGLLAGICGIYLGSLSVAWCLIFSGIANFLPCVWLRHNRTTLLNAFRHLALNRQVFKKLFYFGKYGVLLSLVGSLSTQSGIFLSAELLDLAATALIGLGARYALLLTIPGNSISSLIYPEVLKCGTDSGRLKQVTTLGAGKMYALLVPIGIAVLAGSPFAIWLLHGFDYLFVSVIIMVKTLGFLINLPMSTCYTSVMNTMNRPGQVTKLVVVNGVINILLMAPLMYLMGLWGVLAATVIVESIGFMIMRQGLKNSINFETKELSVKTIHFWTFWWEKYRPVLSIYTKKATS